MPVSPSPGKGISTSGLNKTTGWGSTDVNGGVIPGHEGDQGINHIQGLSEFGLDVGSAVFVQTKAPTAITATTATVNWQTTPAAPAGTIRYRLAGAGMQSGNTVVETAGTKSAHSIPLTGLVAAKTYEYTITQPSPVAGGVVVEFSGRVHTTGGTVEDPEGLSSGLDGPARNRVPDPNFGSSTTGTTGAPAPPGPETREASKLEISGVQAQALDSTTVHVTWRTDGYADGQVDWEGAGGAGGAGDAGTVVEDGNKRMNHLIVLGDLKPGTEYTLTVTSQDAAGDEAAEDVKVSTPAD